ncbi:MAG: efflux RND transporter periplasmic adaptor subunit [Anaerolineales bacterium]|jgi:RND family efflux transporter MFP subunit
MRIKICPLMLMVMILTIVLQAACSSGSSRADEATPTPLPRSDALLKPTYRVQRGDILVQLQFTGRVAPVITERLFFRVDGRVGRVHVRGDEMVKADQVLATLEALDDLERQQTLQQLSIQRAQEMLEIAKLRLEQIKQQPQNIGADETNYQVLIQEHEVTLARIAVEEAKIKAQDLDELIADAQITAPFDGKILSLQNTEGKTVNAYEVVMVIGDVSALEVSAGLQDSTIRELSEGMPLTAIPEDRPGEQIQGTIRRLPYPYGSGSAEDGEEASTTRIALDRELAEAGFGLGDRLLVTVVLLHKTDALWLPPQAVRTFGGQNFAVVQDNEVQKRVDIELGVQGDGRVEILKGLDEGDIIVSP